MARPLAIGRALALAVGKGEGKLDLHLPELEGPYFHQDACCGAQHRHCPGSVQCPMQLPVASERRDPAGRQAAEPVQDAEAPRYTWTRQPRPPLHKTYGSRPRRRTVVFSVSCNTGAWARLARPALCSMSDMKDKSDLPVARTLTSLTRNKPGMSSVIGATLPLP